ncbi:DUF4145 domain-containing protein [Bacillus pseudomycoides]|uniref:DUF4145 domain-containing protein n=1 Tax=Bacillus pseudomycoides TaxID=64104 RepID=UPI003D196C7F
MKSMVFKFNTDNVEVTNNPKFEVEDRLKRYPYLCHFKIPILPAFSVEYFSVEVKGDTLLLTNEKLTSENTVTIERMVPYIPDDIDSVLIVVHYHGIRDYGLLFPQVTKERLKRDLGLFYEEAEKSFDNGAWLSFALMCGAVFEGMLYDKLGYPKKENSFVAMTNEAFDNKIINKQQKDILDYVRGLRNRIHCNKFNSPYVSRTDAMDMKSLLDRLIKDFSL